MSVLWSPGVTHRLLDRDTHVMTTSHTGGMIESRSGPQGCTAKLFREVSLPRKFLNSNLVVRIVCDMHDFGHMTHIYYHFARSGLQRCAFQWLGLKRAKRTDCPLPVEPFWMSVPLTPGQLSERGNLNLILDFTDFRELRGFGVAT